MGKRIAPDILVPANIKTSKRKTSRNKVVKSLDFSKHATAVYQEAAHKFLCKSDTLTPTSFFVAKSPTVTINQSNKQANNTSIILNKSSSYITPTTTPNVFQHTESPKPVYSLRPSLVNGTILKDLMKKLWRLGPPIGKGNFGEIFLASDDIGSPVTNANAKFVVKIEPHSNGPLFVEIHCLISTAKTLRNPSSTVGIPAYIASGSHYFGDARYRFLVLPRFDCDLHSLIRNCRLKDSCVITLGLHILNTLEVLHNRGYCHNDIKAQNLMITRTCASNNGQEWKQEQLNNSNGKCDYEEKQHTTDSGNSSEQEEIEDEHRNGVNGNKKCKKIKRKCGNYVVADYDDCYVSKRNFIDDDEVITTTTNSNDSNSFDAYTTPINRMRTERRQKRIAAIQYQGSNPVRSCRKKLDGNNSTMYEEMVKSHYLRPRGRVSYCEFFDNEAGAGVSSSGESTNTANWYMNSHLSMSDDDEYNANDTCGRDFVKHPVESKKNASIKKLPRRETCQRLTRRQEKKLLSEKCKNEMSYFQPKETNYNAGDQLFLIDFGLASKFTDNGLHRPFLMDQRRAHDGTLEFTSRDAHMGAHSRRSDLECLGYNLLFWSQGYLPWRETARQHQMEQVHRAKEYLMTDVRSILKNIYGEQVPTFIGDFLHLISQLGYQERPDYARYRKFFKRKFRQTQTNGTINYAMKLSREDIRLSCITMNLEQENNILEYTPLQNGVNSNIHYKNQPDSNSFNTPKPLSIISSPFSGRFSIVNRVSPKNLRSKSSKKILKSEEDNHSNISPIIKNLTWPEILSKHADKIAHCRAEKEFEREEELLSKTALGRRKIRQYEGEPTYAILEMLHRRGVELPAFKIELKIRRENNDNSWRLTTKS